MSFGVDRFALEYWALAAVLLFAKMFVNSGVQGWTRIRNKAFVHPEDAAFFGGVQPRERELPLVETAADAWRNDLENIPIFLFLSLGAVLLGGTSFWVGGYCAVFVLARALHTAFYFAHRQPHRNLAYQLGLFATIATAIHVVSLL